MAKDEMRRIRSLRKRLNKSIIKNGINSNETREISDEMDKLINEYYDEITQAEYPDDSDMLVYYSYSYIALKNLTKELKRFPTVDEWNRYSQKNNYLCHLSLEYISELKWNYIRVKVLREINMKI